MPSVSLLSAVRGFASALPKGAATSLATRSMRTTAAALQIAEGETVPSVVFKTRVRTAAPGDNPFDWQDTTSEDYFKGKRIALFALPGAFTPTCSSTHLPGYESAYEDIKSQGIDQVYCLSVNDAFVMRAWGISQGLVDTGAQGTPDYFKSVQLIPDGHCHFTRGMGMSCTWEKERGFGERSWRYSAVINDMQVEKLFVEPDRVEDSGPDPFVVSDAATMLEYLKSQ